MTITIKLPEAEVKQAKSVTLQREDQERSGVHFFTAVVEVVLKGEIEA